jgi:hypothetical protein
MHTPVADADTGGFTDVIRDIREICVVNYLIAAPGNWRSPKTLDRQSPEYSSLFTSQCIGRAIVSDLKKYLHSPFVIPVPFHRRNRLQELGSILFQIH